MSVVKIRNKFHIIKGNMKPSNIIKFLLRGSTNNVLKFNPRSLIVKYIKYIADPNINIPETDFVRKASEKNKPVKNLFAHGFLLSSKFKIR